MNKNFVKKKNLLKLKKHCTVKNIRCILVYTPDIDLLKSGNDLKFIKMIKVFKGNSNYSSDMICNLSNDKIYKKSSNYSSVSAVKINNFHTGSKPLK